MKADANECTVQDSGICSVHHLCDANTAGIMELMQADWRDFQQALVEIQLQHRRMPLWRGSSLATFLLGWVACWVMLR